MQKVKYATLALALGVGFFFSSLIQAEELKVLDSIGLTRAVKQVAKSARVEIRLKDASQSADLELVSVDGLSAPLKSQINGNSVVFNSVPAGEWKIQSQGTSPSVLEVKIVQ
jgi:hypothetical protein